VAIYVRCHCGREFQTRDENQGRRARCPDCGRELVVPEAAGEPGEEPWSIPGARPLTSGRVVASLALGLASFGCGFLTGVPAVILGTLGLNDVHRGRGALRGASLAVAGVVLGGLGTIVTTVVLLVPALQAARESARRSQCQDNLTQIGLAMHNFAGQTGRLPAAAITDRQGVPLLSWRVAILPYLGEQKLFEEFRLDEPWDSPHNKALIPRMPKVFACPSDPSTARGATGYVVIVGPNTLFRGKPAGFRIEDVADGTTNTVMAVESPQTVPWTAPQELAVTNVALHGCGSFHAGGFHALFADGSVRFLGWSISPATLDALLTPAGGEVVSSSAF
jgi:prepilin-type processing-associated H-X9-DG protein